MEDEIRAAARQRYIAALHVWRLPAPDSEEGRTLIESIAVALATKQTLAKFPVLVTEETDLSGIWMGAARVIDPGEEVDFIVCIPFDGGCPLRYPDNLSAICVDCGRRVQHRPRVPSAPKLCVFCAAQKENSDD